MTRVDALLVAGGTGGHVYPAIAVANVLSRDDAWNIRFAVDARPASADAVARAGFELDILPLRRGLQRRLAWSNVRSAIDGARATLSAWRLVRRLQPRVVVGFGAYVTVPVLVAARLHSVPLVVHEQNGRPGLANRLAVRLGARAATSIPGTPLPGAIVTGNPVRPEIANVIRAPATPPLVGVVGASLGAGALNDAAFELYDLWRDRDDVAVHHVTGERHFGECAKRLEARRTPGDRLRYTLVAYEHDMPGLYRRATVMVTRAGGSVAELAAAAVPAIIVPWSGAAEDHQTANARRFALDGAAVNLPEGECRGARLAAEIEGLLSDPARLESMAGAMRRLARPDAAERVAALIRDAARDGGT